VAITRLGGRSTSGDARHSGRIAGSGTTGFGRQSDGRSGGSEPPLASWPPRLGRGDDDDFAHVNDYYFDNDHFDNNDFDHDHHGTDDDYHGTDDDHLGTDDNHVARSAFLWAR
jgi:hypothetical protein